MLSPERKKRKSVAERHMSRCRHFNGLMNTICLAGVAYADVRREAPKPYLFPCLKEDGISELCAKCDFPTAEEGAAHEAEVEAAVERFFAAVKAGLCPRCGRKVTRQRQVGRCVYAEPCGCRLWQGQAMPVDGNPPAGDPYPNAESMM